MKKPARKTIYIECTGTYRLGLNTGIQRVVRNILRHLPIIADQHGYDVKAIVLENSRLVVIDPQIILDRDQSPFDTKKMPILAKFRRLIARYWNKNIRWKIVKLSCNFRSEQNRDFEGSSIILLDSAWSLPIWKEIKYFKECGGSLCGIVYDLIQITNSTTSSTRDSEKFKHFLSMVFQYSDCIMCISKSVANDLKLYAERNSDQLAPASIPPISYFHLGSELDFIGRSDEVRSDIVQIFASARHSFLMVGSIAPHKKHDYVLDAFDRFWATGGVGALVVLGRESWKTDAYLNRVAAHPQLGRQLFILRDASDTELDYSYRNASALICASEIEGFGLPVVEAFQRGLPVLCSDIPVFREIAEGRAAFFSLEDVGSLVTVLDEFYVEHPVDDRKRRRPYKWLSWKESAAQLFERMSDAMGHDQGRGRPAPDH